MPRVLNLIALLLLFVLLLLLLLLLQHLGDAPADTSFDSEQLVGEDAAGHLYWLLTQQGDPTAFKLYRVMLLLLLLLL